MKGYLNILAFILEFLRQIVATGEEKPVTPVTDNVSSCVECVCACLQTSNTADSSNTVHRL